MDLSTLKNIAAGYTNLLKDKANILPEDIKKLSDTRMEICRSCPSNQFNEIDERCKLCKCYMPAATKAIGKECPDNHW